jgi:hypothetical protein
VIYRPSNPNWFYSSVNIPNLETIKQELINLHYSVESSKVVHLNPVYANVFARDVTKCPTFLAYIESLGLTKKFNKVLYSSGDVNTSKPHVDSGNPNLAKYSLNIPLMLTEGSYTSWYSIKGNVLSDYSQFGNSNPAGMACWINEDIGREEIARLYYTDLPAMINISLLHQGHAPLKGRLVVCVRFHPELTLEELGRVGVVLPSLKDSNTL